MPSIDLLVETHLTRTSRVKQLEGMFDVPGREKLRHEWKGNVPFEDRPWSVGLIVGPSGCGKSQVVKHFFGEGRKLEWSGASVVDDFSKDLSMEDIASACSAVGFNTIPSWMKPYAVLSNGEQFRVDLARRLVEDPDPIVVDEFTSVVDRQVAKIAAHAVQKHVRRASRRFVAATCHYDVIEWLQPDWVFEPATMSFTWRELQRRPAVECEISRVPYSTWRIFAPYHYLTAELHRGSKCFALFVDGVLAAFSAVLHRPHPKYRNIFGISRAVTLPDFQGLGLIFALMDTLGAAYKARGAKFHIYPAHPSFIRSADRNPNWKLEQRPGRMQTGTLSLNKKKRIGGRPCAVFSYCGAPMDRQVAQRLIEAEV